MKRFFVLLVLLHIAAPSLARANWVLLGENERAEVYIDNAGIVRPPAYVKAWTMLSFKSRQRGGWLSEKRLFMFSCKDQSLDWQQSMYYSDRMGEGDLVHVRTLTRYGVGDLRLAELDPSTKDMNTYKDAVPESRFVTAFRSLC